MSPAPVLLGLGKKCQPALAERLLVLAYLGPPGDPTFRHSMGRLNCCKMNLFASPLGINTRG